MYMRSYIFLEYRSTKLSSFERSTSMNVYLGKYQKIIDKLVSVIASDAEFIIIFFSDC